MPFHRACLVEEVPEGAGRQVLVAGHAIAVFRLPEGIVAISGICPHRGGPLGEGRVSAGELTCPWHGWRFDLATGACLEPAAAGCLARHPVRVEGGAVLVEI